MTVGQAIAWVDEKKHNVYSREDKRRWLYTLESLLRGYEGMYGPVSYPTWESFTENYSLIAPAESEQIYLRWLEYQMDYANQDYRRSNNDLAMFRAEESAYLRRLCRTHRRAGATLRYW